jgi:hypothetical protein
MLLPISGQGAAKKSTKAPAKSASGRKRKTA